MRLFGAEEMALWLRALAALQEDPFLITSTHKAAHNVHYSSLRGSDTLFWQAPGIHMEHRHTCSKTPLPKNKNKS